MYEGLHQYAKEKLSKAPVVLLPDLRAPVGDACLAQFAKEGVILWAISVGGEHVHAALVCLPEGLKQMIGRVKKVSSHRIRDRIPGTVRSQGCHPVVVKDDGHWNNVIQYIRDHAANSWLWMREGV